MALRNLEECFGLGQGSVGKSGAGGKVGGTDHAREVGAVLELAQHHGEKEGTSHEYKGEEGCVGQGSLRFGHHCHIVVIMLLQRVVLEDLEQKTKASYFPHPSIHHPSINLPIIYPSICPSARHLSIHPSILHPSIHFSSSSTDRVTEGQWDSTAWFSGVKTSLSLGGAGHGGNECRCAWEHAGSRRYKAGGQERSAKGAPKKGF